MKRYNLIFILIFLFYFGCKDDISKIASPGLTPHVIEIFPPEGYQLVQPTSTIRITFSTEMDPTSTQNAISLDSGNLSVPIRYNWPNANTLECQPTYPLLEDRLYVLSISKEAKSKTGVNIKPYKSIFYTFSLIEPTAISMHLKAINLNPSVLPYLRHPIKFSWATKYSGVMYHLQVSSKKDFSTLLVDKYTPSTYYVWNIDKNSLDVNKTFYWRVRAIDRLSRRSSPWKYSRFVTLDDEMVYIPETEFNLRFSPTYSEPWQYKTVILSNYLISKYEVSIELYLKFVNTIITEPKYVEELGGINRVCLNVGIEVTGTFDNYSYVYPISASVNENNQVTSCYLAIPNISNRPITNITWHIAKAFTDFLTYWNKSTYDKNLDIISNGNTFISGFRLPTYAEWMYAAIGNTNSSYPWGNDEPASGFWPMNYDCDDTHDNNLCALDGFGTSQPAATSILSIFAPVNYYDGIRGNDGRSPFGIYNMAGNASEYLSDFMNPFYIIPYFQLDTTELYNPQSTHLEYDYYYKLVMINSAFNDKLNNVIGRKLEGYYINEAVPSAGIRYVFTP